MGPLAKFRAAMVRGCTHRHPSYCDLMYMGAKVLHSELHLVCCMCNGIHRLCGWALNSHSPAFTSDDSWTKSWQHQRSVATPQPQSSWSSGELLPALFFFASSKLTRRAEVAVLAVEPSSTAISTIHEITRFAHSKAMPRRAN